MNDTAEIPSFPLVTPVGVTGYLVRFGNAMSDSANRAALRFHQFMQDNPLNGVEETAPSLISVFVRIDPLNPDADHVAADLAALIETQDWFTEEAQSSRLWTIPCCFDGPQLGEAAQMAGLSEAQAIAEIENTPVRVLTIGFAPGQPYMGTLPPAWDIPRLQGVTPNVPRSALVVAVRQLVIFSYDTPTGWRHVGQTAFRCFDNTRAETFALRPGDRVQFARANRSDIDDLVNAPDGLGGARCE